MSELITGIVSGVVASIVFYTFLLLVRPKIDVSRKVCGNIGGGGGALVRIKVVNKTRFMLTNVKYVLHFCQSQGEGVHQVEVLLPCKPSLGFIDRYSRNDVNAEYAVRFLYEIPSHIRLSEGWLEFSIYANHGFSGTCACVKRRYGYDDVIPGLFETGTSMRILAVAGTETSGGAPT